MTESLGVMIGVLTGLWREYKKTCIVVILVGVTYLANIIDSRNNPWTLWKQKIGDFHEQNRVGSHEDRKLCWEAQAQMLKDEFETRQRVNKMVAQDVPLFGKRVFIAEGATIFEFKKSIISSLGAGRPLPPEMQTEVSSTVSFICAPTASFYGFWPYHRPTFDAASVSLERLGERTLLIRAKQMLGD